MPRRNTITPDELREAKCSACGGTDPQCDGSEPLVINSRCHTRQGVQVGYVKNIHSLVLECATCREHIITIALDRQVVERRHAVPTTMPKPEFYECKKCGFFHAVELRVDACRKDRGCFGWAVLNDHFGVDGWVDVTNKVAKQS